MTTHLTAGYVEQIQTMKLNLFIFADCAGQIHKYCGIEQARTPGFTCIKCPKKFVNN